VFTKILIANRGEIACRVIRSAREMGIATVAVHSEADRRAVHVEMADQAVEIGPAAAARSYLDIERVIEAARATGAEAIHPGYGFLSENARFAEALAEAGIAFIGPPPAAIRAMGDKITSKRLAAEAGVSTVPGHADLIEDDEEAVRIARGIGYPVMIKATAGGGGKGMRIAHGDGEVRDGLRAARGEAAGAFGDDRIFIEKFVTRPRHIEIQVLADSHGNVIHLGERECSIQRRNQKVIEESPSPFLDGETRAAMGAQACALARAVGYTTAGTVEFIADEARNFYFLEMNTRLQVEHPVTELVTGVDLVEEMIRVAAGETLSLSQSDITQTGWAIESRLYAEDPLRGFLPSTGRLTRYRPPETPVTTPEARLRTDTGVAEGGEISMHYDPMIAKLCAWAPDRDAAIAEMTAALDAFEIEGIGHNLPFLSAVMAHPRFRAGDITTAFLEEEFADGFSGVSLTDEALERIAAAAAAMFRLSEIRRARVSDSMDGHPRRVGRSWVVTLAGRCHALTVSPEGEAARVTFADGRSMHVASGWRPGQRLARLSVDDEALILKADPIIGGFRLRTGGADIAVQVHTPRQAVLTALMPDKPPADTSRMLLCPMPGTLIRLDVDEGAEVQAGQALCTVEAMKMENTLRAERQTRIARIHAGPGDSLSVDQVILEFGD